MLNRNMFFFLDIFTFFFSDQSRMVAMIEILWKMFIRRRQKKMISHTDIFFFGFQTINVVEELQKKNQSFIEVEAL